MQTVRFLFSADCEKLRLMVAGAMENYDVLARSTGFSIVIRLLFAERSDPGAGFSAGTVSIHRIAAPLMLRQAQHDKNVIGS